MSKTVGCLLGCAGAFILFVLVLVFFGYGVFKKMSHVSGVAEKAVVVFHQQYNGSRFSDIYHAATPDFKKTYDESEFQDFMQGVHNKLGAFKSASLTGVNINETNSVVHIELTYNSVYEQGSATEKFEYLLSDGNATLLDYDINSKLFVTR